MGMYGKNGQVILHDIELGKWTYPLNSMIFEPNIEADTSPWDYLLKVDAISAEDAEVIRIKVEILQNSADLQSDAFQVKVRNARGEEEWYFMDFIHCDNRMAITMHDVTKNVKELFRVKKMIQYDKLTGLMKRDYFFEQAGEVIFRNAKAVIAGEYVMGYLDVYRFKAINDMFGSREGDRLLNYIADGLRAMVGRSGMACRINADRFLFFMNKDYDNAKAAIKVLLSKMDNYNLGVDVICNVGYYVTDDATLPPEYMADRANMAEKEIKGNFTKRHNRYRDDLRRNMLDEQAVAGEMKSALEQGQFVAYYQPQYNHTSGALVGAEALIRWIHPEHGILSPGVFIPVFEKTGFITEADLYVFECVCRLQRKCIDKGYGTVPISANISRHDIYQVDFIDRLEAIRCKYNIPVELLRLEITETDIMGDAHYINDIVTKLHSKGYIVEMDDFGSGYSSLNVLKDIDVDIIKLDMKFFSGNNDKKKGGTIVSSVVRMAKWLAMPIIAEGVETGEQADFLRSIGSDFIQGYFYSRPMPENEFLMKLQADNVDGNSDKIEILDSQSIMDFWNPESAESKLFNEYIGGACIFKYEGGEVEYLRLNKSYLHEMGMNQSEQAFITIEQKDPFDDENRAIYRNCLLKAIETGEEQECETWRTLQSDCCGEEHICIRSNVKLIGKSNTEYLFFCTVKNITESKLKQEALQDTERRFKHASEQAKIYFWEYNILTKEMRPCFRCMRDLGLPSVVRNYPEPLIEEGIFPSEIADDYRELMKRVDCGETDIEEIVPLTMNRIPFIVRYTTECDAAGHPIKAYGSATMVVQ